MNIDLYTGTPREYMDAILQYRQSDYLQVAHYCQLLLSYGKEKKDAALMGFSLYYMAESHFTYSNVQQALTTLLDSIHHLEQINDYSLLTRCYNLMGVIYDTQGNVPSAMEQYFIALSYCHQDGNPYLEGVLNFNIATTYNNLQDYSSAVKYYRSAISYYKKAKKDSNQLDNILLAYSSLGQCLRRLNRKKQAEKTKDQVLGLLEQTSASRYLSSVYLFLVQYYHMVQDIDQMDHYTRLTIENAAKSENFINQIDDYQTFCKLLLQTEKYDFFQELFAIVDTSSRVLDNNYILFQNCQIWLSYLKKTEQTEAYYRALEEYYRLSEQQNLEDLKMSYSSMQICFSYEQAMQKQKKLSRKGERLRQLSEMDEMTGLPNRFRLNDYLDEAFERAYHEQTPIAIEILDIDFFKQYNDTYGHIAGDACLRLLAAELKAMTSPDVFCARYGGDEFIIIYTHKSPDEVMALAQDLKDRVYALQQPHASSTAAPYVTISQGISWRIPQNITRSWDYLHDADQALYQLKKSSRNDIVLYT